MSNSIPTQRPRSRNNPVRYFALSALSAIVGILGYRTAVGAEQIGTAAMPTVDPIAPPQITADLGTKVAEPVVPIDDVEPGPAGMRDGTFIGQPVDFRHGTVQVSATIDGGRIVDIQVQYPQDSRSLQINAMAVPQLVSEAIDTQSSNVHLISGATFTSQTFSQSLQSALDQAH